jgi:hypothetical protein
MLGELWIIHTWLPGLVMVKPTPLLLPASPRVDPGGTIAPAENAFVEVNSVMYAANRIHFAQLDAFIRKTSSADVKALCVVDRFFVKAV